jgi:hypothetical protein
MGESKMSSLDIKSLDIKSALNRNTLKTDVSLKRDGTEMYYKNGDLISSRGIIRTDRFRHIAGILRKANCVNLIGEVYLNDNSNVFDVTSSKNWNNCKFMPFDIVSNQSTEAKQRLIDEIVDRINSPFITKPIRFNSVQEGWDYVVKNNQEGLVLKNDYEWNKIKKLLEGKFKIMKHEKGSEKGTFVLENGSRISGTSISFVKKFEELSKSDDVIAEVEYCFITDSGKLFQPRLRDIYAEA